MNGELERALRTALRFASVTELSVPFRTGSPNLMEPMRFCTLGLAM